MSDATSDPVEVLGCDPAATLSVIVNERRTAEAAAARELLAVTHFADLHRISGVGAVHDDISIWLASDSDRARRAGSSTLGLEGTLRLAGEGAFTVEEFAVAELAVALGISESAGRAYVGQALELRDRLPRCWDQVMAGRLPTWKARRIAEQTIPFTAAVADAVDASLALIAARMTPHRIERAVEAALLRHDPETAREREEAAAEKRGAWFEDRLDGTTDLHALLETPDAHALDHALDTVATTLGTLGDTDTRHVRRARALGVLADPQYALDLTSALAPDSADPKPPARLLPTLHLHLHVDAVEGCGTSGPVAGVAGVAGVARVDRDGRQLGARSLAVAERWLAGLTPGTTLKVTPMVDLAARISVDSHEIPPSLRRQVAERDHFCRFPWCTNTGRYDIDHIDPYLDPDDGGPPGQTSTQNLARLCRFHHRVKTHGAWHYQRDPDTDVLTWTSPHGRTYTVDEHGTYPQH